MPLWQRNHNKPPGIAADLRRKGGNHLLYIRTVSGQFQQNVQTVLLLANSVTKPSSFKEEHRKHFYRGLRCFLECKAMVSGRFSYLPKLEFFLLHLTCTHISPVNKFHLSTPAQKRSREGPEATSSYAEHGINKKHKFLKPGGY